MSRMATGQKIGKVGPTTSAPSSVSTQPAMGTGAQRPFEAGGDQSGEVPHFANNVGKTMGKAGGISKHWSGK